MGRCSQFPKQCAVGVQCSYQLVNLLYDCEDERVQSVDKESTYLRIIKNP